MSDQPDLLAEISDPCCDHAAEVDRLRAELDDVIQELGDQEARDRHLQADALDWAAQQLHRYGAHHEEVGTVREWAGEVRAGTRTITTTQEAP